MHRPQHEERRKSEELSPEIIALIASCGERVRESDSAALRSCAANVQQRDPLPRSPVERGEGAATVPDDQGPTSVP